MSSTNSLGLILNASLTNVTDGTAINYYCSSNCTLNSTTGLVGSCQTGTNATGQIYATGGSARFNCTEPTSGYYNIYALNISSATSSFECGSIIHLVG